jgi:nucleoside-diphosphate-sugar epimerase
MEREAKLTQLIDSNVIEACMRLSIKIIYFSTSLIYGHPKSEKYSEIDLWTSQINKTNRGHYASAKQIATLKIAELNQMGFPFSSVVLPNLLAGPLPGLERIDHLCEKLYQLVKESQKENRKTIDFDVSHNPRLQMLSSLEVAEWVLQNIETKLPGVVNLTNLNCIKPSDLLESIIESLELDIKVNCFGIESNGASILLTDALARTNFAWTGGLSSRSSLESWISELKNEKLL